MKKSARGPLIYIIGIALVLLLIQLLTVTPKADTRKLEYKEFLQLVKDKGVSQVEVVGEDLFALKTGTEINPEKFPAEYDYYVFVNPETLSGDLKAITGASSPADMGSNLHTLRYRHHRFWRRCCRI